MSSIELFTHLSLSVFSARTPFSFQMADAHTFFHELTVFGNSDSF